MDEKVGEYGVALTFEELWLENTKRRMMDAGDDVDKARKAVDKARKDVDKARKDVDKARNEVDNARNEVDKTNNKTHEWESGNDDNDKKFIYLPARRDRAMETLHDAMARRVMADERLKTANSILNNAQRQWNDAQRQWNEAQDAKPASKQARHGDHFDWAPAATALMERIHDVNVDFDTIFDIETVVRLPFPSLSTPPNRFHVIDGYFEYQARSKFKHLHDRVVQLWTNGLPITVKVAGTIGYGKSHLLAVLVLLLLKNQPKNEFGTSPFVCYIPDCRIFFGEPDNVIGIMQRNILLNYPDYTGPISTMEEIFEVMKRQSVILVADQWTSIDYDDPQCQRAHELFDDCLGASVVVAIHGVSIDTESWRDLSRLQTSDYRHFCFGGLDDNEFEVWLQRHPEIVTAHKDELALLTGKVPLLLSVFECLLKDHPSWETVLQKVEQSSIVAELMRMLSKFYNKIDSNEVWKVFTLSAHWIADEANIDFRFFYRDGKPKTSATSEIVLRLLYRVWLKKGADDALVERWHELPNGALQNPCSRAFYVGEIIKAHICRRGLGVHTPPKNGIKRHFFLPENEKSALKWAKDESGKHECWILLDPQTFNYPGVDMILFTGKSIIGIKVTIANTHSSLQPFLNIWRPLAVEQDMSIQGLFVAPDAFQYEEANVRIVLLRHECPELWKYLDKENQVLRDDRSCGCVTGCGKRCGCRRHGRLCDSRCRCWNCENGSLTRRVGADLDNPTEPNQDKTKKSRRR